VDPIALNKTDKNFKDEVAALIGIEEIKPCYTCGSCTGVCPVREVADDFDPRKLIHMIILGMKKEVLSSDLIWFCCLCNSCYSVCPQGIKFSRTAKELQKMAVKEGYVSDEFLNSMEKVNDYLEDLCRRTMFSKVRQGFQGPHTMPCWRKLTLQQKVKNGFQQD
jgi:heterodisulfide reductase subunit C